MNSTIGRALAVLVAVAVVAVASVVAVDRWRAAGVRAPDCGSVILTDARGTLVGDTGLQAAAWSAVTDPGPDAIRGLDGPRPVLERSCLLYAGAGGGSGGGVDDDPSVVFVESTSSGRSELLRVVEVRPRSGTLAATGYPAQIGAETAAGVVLPLSGTYLAPPDVETVTVLGPPARAAGTAAAGLFEIGTAPAALLLRRGDGSAPVLVVVPALAVEGRRPLRTPVELTIDGQGTTDPATLAAVEQVLPLFLADARLPALLRRTTAGPVLAVRTAVIPGGRGVVVESPDQSTDPGLPQFRYFVPTVGPVVAGS